MLSIECPDKFAEAMQFAINHQCASKLIERLDYLASYGGDDSPTRCILISDFAPLSFNFTMLRADDSRWFCGGLIYQGPGARGDGSFPSLTVNLGSDTALHQWGVHT